MVAVLSDGPELAFLLLVINKFPLRNTSRRAARGVHTIQNTDEQRATGDILPFAFAVLVPSWQLKTSWGYNGIMEKKMETTIMGYTMGYIGVVYGLHWGYIGIMEKKMETSMTMI